MDENKEIKQYNNQTTDRMEQNQNKNINQSGNEIVEMILGFVFLAIFVFIIIGAFANDCVKCTWCGDDANRVFIYEHGKELDGSEYLSCVGPAGCVGCGFGAKCWPTECLYIKMPVDEHKELSGCVTYYNKAGCIAKSDVYSVGRYSTSASCLGIACAGESYVEEIAESERAVEQNTFMGVGCGNKVDTDVRRYNDASPRQFPKGCWGVSKKKEGGE